MNLPHALIISSCRELISCNNILRIVVGQLEQVTESTVDDGLIGEHVGHLIVFFTHFENLHSLYLSTGDFVYKIGIAQCSEVVENGLGGKINLLLFEIFADVLCREQTPCIIG